MAVSKRAKTLYNKIFESPELYAANLISNIQERRHLHIFRDKDFKLSLAQKQEIRNFWKPYKQISTDWAAYYCAMNDVFDPRYIPNDLYYSVIDQHFNNRKLGYGFNDKNYYSKIFDDIPQPKTVIRKINSMLYDEDYNLISIERGVELLEEHTEVICKPSQESGSGRGIEFIKTVDTDNVKKVLSSSEYNDYIIQALLKQHPELDKIHESSINSIRICSLLMDEQVYILSAVLRMGAGGSRVDNATSGANAQFGGMTVGITEEGKLKKYSYGYYDGHKRDRHPGGMIFENFQIPSFNKAVELVMKAHPRIGHFRLVSWDIAVDENGEAIMIEANMRKGSINFHQFNNGPLFENVMFQGGGRVIH